MRRSQNCSLSLGPLCGITATNGYYMLLCGIPGRCTAKEAVVERSEKMATKPGAQDEDKSAVWHRESIEVPRSNSNSPDPARAERPASSLCLGSWVCKMRINSCEKPTTKPDQLVCAHGLAQVQHCCSECVRGNRRRLIGAERSTSAYKQCAVECRLPMS